MVDPERRPFRAILALVAKLEMPDTLANAMDPALKHSADGLNGNGYSPAVLLPALTIWSRLSGVISLEINGVLDRMGVDATSFFDAELAQLLPGGLRFSE